MTDNKKFIPLAIPAIQGKEWEYIKDCLDTGWVSSAGSYVNKFEQVVAEYVGCNHAVACSSGTAALHTALMVAGIGADDEVLMPTITFVAPANAVRYTGAYPVFMDIQPDTWQLDTNKVKDFLLKECDVKDGQCVNKHTQRNVKAILPVHILGHPVDIDPILELAKKFNLIVIEDAAESIGAIYKEKKVGAIGDIGCFSFNGNKIITAGGGGMLVTNNQQWAEKARYLTTQAKDEPVESIHNAIGYNYRLTNIQAAMGVAQMECLDKYIEVKRAIAERYFEGLADVAGITLPQEKEWAQSIYWLYTVLIDQNKYGMTSRDLLKKFSECGIETRPLWHPLHRLAPFKDCYAYDICVADDLYTKALSIPSSIELSVDSQQRVIEIIQGAFKG